MRNRTAYTDSVIMKISCIFCWLFDGYSVEFYCSAGDGC